LQRRFLRKRGAAVSILARFPRKKAPLPSRKAVLFSTFFCPDVENPVQF